MKIKITDAACGLEVGKTYNIHHVSAATLVTAGQAELIQDTTVKAEKPPKSKITAKTKSPADNKDRTSGKKKEIKS